VADDETVANAVQVNFTLTVTYEYDSSSSTTYTIMIDRNATNWFAFTNANVSLFNDTNSDKAYQFNATSLTETTYGLTEFTTNLETVVWGVTNNAPVNQTTPTINNIDDTNNLYAKYRDYIVIMNVSDDEGYTDIDVILLFVFDDLRGTNYWTIMYDNATDTFSIVNGSAYIALKGSATRSGNWINLTVLIKVDWDHPDVSNLDAKQFCNDTSSDSDTDWYEVNWDVETRLDYSTEPYLSDDRGSLSISTLWAYMVVVYYNSGGDNYPFANETDVWILHDVSNTWSGNVDVSGICNITSISSSSIARLDTYTFKVVVQGDGSTGSDLYYTTSLTDTYIADRIIIVLTSSTTQAPPSEMVTFTLTLIYEYDSASVTAFTVSIYRSSVPLMQLSNTTTFQDDGPADTFVFTINSITETTYGITAFSSNSVTVLWESPHGVPDDDGVPEPDGPIIGPYTPMYVLFAASVLGAIGLGGYLINSYVKREEEGFLTPSQRRSGSSSYYPKEKGIVEEFMDLVRGSGENIRESVRDINVTEAVVKIREAETETRRQLIREQKKREQEYSKQQKEELKKRRQIEREQLERERKRIKKDRKDKRKYKSRRKK
jgi:hypothetical protein